MFGENTALIIAWLGLALGIINLGWNLLKFQIERRDKARVRLSIGGGPGKIGVTVTNLGHVPRFFEHASIVWKERIDTPFLARLLSYVGLEASYTGIGLEASSNSKEPTAVMDTKTFECPLDQIELEEALKTKKRIGLWVTCRDGGTYSDFHWLVRESIRMHLDWYKRGAFGPPQDREEKPNQQPKAETLTPSAN